MVIKFNEDKGEQYISLTKYEGKFTNTHKKIELKA